MAASITGKKREREEWEVAGSIYGTEREGEGGGSRVNSRDQMGERSRISWGLFSGLSRSEEWQGGRRPDQFTGPSERERA